MTMTMMQAPRDLFAAPEAVPVAAPPLQVVVEIPGPPRGKGRPRFVRATGRTYTDAKTENYEGMLRQEAALVMRGRPPMDGPVWMTVEAVFPVPTSWSLKKQAAALRRELRPTSRPDADNIMKLSDGLNGIVFRDDAQVVEAKLVKVYGERPCVRISVGPLA